MFSRLGATGAAGLAIVLLSLWSIFGGRFGFALGEIERQLGLGRNPPPAEVPGFFGPLPQGLPEGEGVYLGFEDGSWLGLVPLDLAETRFCLRLPPGPGERPDLMAALREAFGLQSGHGRAFRALYLDGAGFAALPEVDPAGLSRIYIHGTGYLGGIENLTVPLESWAGGAGFWQGSPLRLYRSGWAGCSRVRAEEGILSVPALAAGAIGGGCLYSPYPGLHHARAERLHAFHARRDGRGYDLLRSRRALVREHCGRENPQVTERIGVILHLSGRLYGYRFTEEAAP